MARTDARVYAQQQRGQTAADSSENGSNDGMRSSSSGSSRKQAWDAGGGGAMADRSSGDNVRSHAAPQRKVRKSTHIVRKVRVFIASMCVSV